MLDLPFFEAHHRALAAWLDRFVATAIEPEAQAAEADPVEAGRRFLRACAEAGLLGLLVPPAFAPRQAAWRPQGQDDRARPPGARPGTATTEALDLRALCLAREALATASALADATFAVQGLGSYPIVLAGDEAQRRRYLPRVAAGELVAAFAVTEPEAGSDVAAIQTTVARDGDGYVLDGTKSFISNAGLADFYVVFARSDPATAPAAGEVPGGRPRPLLTAWLVDATRPGVRVSRLLRLLAPHPIGDVVFERCRLDKAARLGAEGDGFRIALGTLDFYRTTVGAAACGLARRALREARAYAVRRRQFGSRLADFQATRFALADMQAELDAARLLVYRAAWRHDAGAARITREAALAKLFATEAAQRIVDRAVQIHGGLGVVHGTVVERLYREVRALRIYEGTSEIQRLVIAEQLLKDDD